MFSSKTKTTVISLGGSLIVPDDIDTAFVGLFVDFLKKRVEKGENFVVITGGGKICRRYQKAGSILGVVSHEDNDWIGIYVTRLNGHFLRIVLGDLAYKDLITDPRDVNKSDKPIVVAAGWKPGWSTDFDSIQMAKEVGAKRVINLSNIDYIYDKDPKVFRDAQKIEKIKWADFRKIIPEKWEPGLNSPFDPIAAKEAEGAKIEVAVLNGKDIANFEKCINGEDFTGSLIY